MLAKKFHVETSELVQDALSASFSQEVQHGRAAEAFRLYATYHGELELTVCLDLDFVDGSGGGALSALDSGPFEGRTGRRGAGGYLSIGEDGCFAIGAQVQEGAGAGGFLHVGGNHSGDGVAADEA